MKQRDPSRQALDLHDAALSSLHRIEAVAGLVQTAAGGREASLDAREIEEATCIIGEETAKVRSALGSMRGLVGSARTRRMAR